MIHAFEPQINWSATSELQNLLHKQVSSSKRKIDSFQDLNLVRGVLPFGVELICCTFDKPSAFGRGIMSAFDLASAFQLVDAALPRVLPLLLKWPPPSKDEMYDVIVALNPFISAYILTFVAIIVQLLFSVMALSCAWNDRIWSILPPLYALLFCAHPIISQDRRTGGFADERLKLMCATVFLWGARLTANALRRGVYNYGTEDYRYTWVRTRLSGAVFAVLYALVGVGACTVLLGLATAPALYFAWMERGTALCRLDYVAAFGCVCAVGLQAMADVQQWTFQIRKRKSERKAGSDEAVGFCRSRLFAWCRHPAYFAEIAMWSSFYIFSVAASNRWLNWCAVGPVLYVVLFLGTARLTEHISVSKYPAYAEYQRNVPCLYPWPPSGRRSTEGHGEAGDKRKDE